MTARRVALITGSSSGIGAAFAHEFARQGYDLVLTARRVDRLEALAQEIATASGAAVTVLPLDLAVAGAAGELAAELDRRGIVVDALVNNAGHAAPPDFGAVNWEAHSALLEVMLVAPVQLAHRLLPAMQARGFGRIVNVASIAGLLPGRPRGALYRPIKAFLIRFSEALWTPDRAHGVHVTALCPGYVLSGFYDVTAAEARRPVSPTLGWLGSDAVARAGYRAVERNRPVATVGIAYRMVAALLAIVPSAWVRGAERRARS